MKAISGENVSSSCAFRWPSTIGVQIGIAPINTFGRVGIIDCSFNIGRVETLLLENRVGIDGQRQCISRDDQGCNKAVNGGV